MLAAATPRDGWDWVLIVFAVIAGVGAVWGVVAAQIALRHARPLFVVDRTLLQSAPDHEHLEFHFSLTIVAASPWRLASYVPIFRSASIWPWRRQVVEGVRGLGNPFPQTGEGSTHVDLAWRIPRPSSDRLHVRVDVRLRRHRRGLTYRGVFDVPPLGAATS